MNLISCNTCGTVLDKDKLKFPTDIYDDVDDDFVSIDLSKARWNGDTYVSFVECPVCHDEILSDNGI